jgi:hypothetical protein
MGRRDPDFSADGLYLPDDVAEMAAAFRVACIKFNALADQDEVRKAMALVIAHHYELGIRPTWRIANAAAGIGRAVAGAKPGPTAIL